MNPYSDWILALPRVDTPFEGLEGRMIAGPHGQTVFFRAEEDFEVPSHSHGGQWGVVVTGTLHLTVDGEENVYKPGDSYNIPAGAEHSARLEAGSSFIDVFQDPDRYQAK